MNEYEQFKHLLEYFVAHLEFCVTGSTVSTGYSKYIQKIDKFTRGGQGHKWQNIQKQIINWDTYDNGTICINVNPTVYKARGCYLNWENTAINVIAFWEGDSIVNLKIVKDSHPIANSKDVVTKSLLELGLFDEKDPNDELKSFFEKFKTLFAERNNNLQNNRNMEKIEPYVKLIKEARNLILTGPPGTGKTFLAKQIAKQMIGVHTDEELEKSGQFSFVQFHPSYDYTDFVEGLRPTKPDSNGNIGFELKDGIFKDFCKKAIGVTAVETGHIDNFELEDYIKYLEALGLHYKTINIYKSKLQQLLGVKELGANREVSNFIQYQSLEDICQNSEEIKYFDNDNNFHNQFASAVSNLLRFKQSLLTNKVTRTQSKPVFVFIIDEINRGEISKIFGELFFSIDPSYRGKKGGVKTQYSNLHDDDNEIFYVPENVYIIGTMNDIDRSVESFDFAMRRRFAWKEISALDSAENMNLTEEAQNKMERLNVQIAMIEGLNSSYHVGASYFLDASGNQRTDYDIVWEHKIAPLIKEYLRGLSDGDEKLNKLEIAYNS